MKNPFEKNGNRFFLTKKGDFYVKNLVKQTKSFIFANENVNNNV